ncbi:MAG: hypothetical protein VCA57_15100 [Pseudomonas sp.]|uniref:hypothetical protein n=1 Tax=Pseudomonas sp. TaxID=306 RepID=UPI003981D571
MLSGSRSIEQYTPASLLAGVIRNSGLPPRPGMWLKCLQLYTAITVLQRTSNTR